MAIDAGLIVAILSCPIILGGGSKAMSAIKDKRDKKKVYDWLYNNSGPNGDLYDISTKTIAVALKMSSERVRCICDNHPQIEPSRVPDSWIVHEPETLIRFI